MPINYSFVIARGVVTLNPCAQYLRFISESSINDADSGSEAGMTMVFGVAILQTFHKGTKISSEQHSILITVKLTFLLSIVQL